MHQNTFHKRVKFAHNIYSQYFELNSQCKACSFSVYNHLKQTLSFHCISWTKSWNMMDKTEDIFAWHCKVDQFVVVTAWPRLEMWSIITLWVDGTKLWSYKVCLIRLPIRLYFAGIWVKKTIAMINDLLTGRCDHMTIVRQSKQTDPDKNFNC